jgi:NhaB family Na+:H+ antiporter
VNIIFNQFLGNSPKWFKLAILGFLIISYPAKLFLGDVVMGWAFIAMFITTLAMALKCYPLQSGGLLGIAILALGLTDYHTVWHEIQQNLEVILLLVFMVSFIYFMKPLLVFIFGKLLVKVKNKIAISLLFSFAAAFLSAFLDALTVTAVLITVFVALYGVYEKVHSTISSDYDHDGTLDRKQLGGDTLAEFRSFIRSLVMHGAVGTALGGVCTTVGEPQNLLISTKMGWDFIEFASQMAHVTIPVFIAGMFTVVAVELTKTFGFGAKLDDGVREILKNYMQEEDDKRNSKEKYGLIIQGISGVLLIVGLALHIM